MCEVDESNSLDNINSKVFPHILKLCCRIQSDISKPVVEETEEASQVAGTHLIQDEQVDWARYLNPIPFFRLHLEGEISITVKAVQLNNILTL